MEWRADFSTFSIIEATEVFQIRRLGAFMAYLPILPALKKKKGMIYEENLTWKGRGGPNLLLPLM